ncbi:DNA-3-methyladenine glycosylase [Podospora aff. communis PSN243]|uniref:DNA-3-methyladenine glycosylase n=1 Tax=Podospora aff. communis PSN243 TaxID=3040156 RepID=A0AAV9GIF3_9PEZI|nr:DNA-3-methyladenine glycosylase [Podospora aff. communis PSN243]
MATRRSARLSAVSNITKAPEPAPAKPPTSRKRKAAPQDAEPVPSDEAPSTPQRRRVRKVNAVPETPTPAAIGLISETLQTNGLAKPKPPAVNRLADPNRTNAPLFSPKTSRIVAPQPLDAVSPSKLPRVKTTTANLLEEACTHLINVDPRMKPLIDKHPCRLFSPEGLAEEIDPFEALVSSIISQQVSGAAAKSIKARFIALFNTSPSDSTQTPSDLLLGKTPHRFPLPSQVLSTPLETLRAAGLSQRKAEYILGLAEHFTSGTLSATLLSSAPYEEILEKLTAVRGLGKWSVEMFACFALKRMDVFSLGDLGVQRGMAAFVGRDVAKLKAKGGKWKYMTEKEMEEISERFRPYRSLFMWYMWRVEETDVSTME